MRKPLFIFLAILLGTCSKPPTLLDEIKQQGELRVVTQFSPTTTYEGADGLEGPEYDLVKGFADFIGVELKHYTVDRFTDLIPEVQSGRAHVAASGITVTPERMKYVDFGPVYQNVTQQLVYKRGTYKPRKLADIQGRQLVVAAGTSYIDTMQVLQNENPDFVWIEDPSSETEDLLIQVGDGEIDFTVADSTIVRIFQNFSPGIHVAMPLGEKDNLAWAFQKRSDSSLLDEAAQYFNYIKTNGELDRIIDRYYGHNSQFDYVGTRTFKRHINSRLDNYADMFAAAADEVGTDWRLLAAISYQESHWNPSAISHTGVRGLMMLTRKTAEAVNVTDRTDPEESIRGGARYLKKMHDRLSDEVPEPDRTWLALAAYNVGFGHLQDAREIVRRQRGNPNSWLDVKQVLPMLANKEYYKDTKFGYARGWEPVRYVDNIRTYYQILRWMPKKELPGYEAPEEPAADSETIAAATPAKFRETG